MEIGPVVKYAIDGVAVLGALSLVRGDPIMSTKSLQVAGTVAIAAAAVDMLLPGTITWPFMIASQA